MRIQPDEARTTPSFSDQGAAKNFFAHAGDLSYAPHSIHSLLAPNGYYAGHISEATPFHIYTFSYDAVPTPTNWHDHLEIFVPIEGEGHYQMGQEMVPFSAGDVVLVDHLRSHRILSFRGENPRAVVLTLKPDMIVDPTCPRDASLLLRPFRAKSASSSRVLSLAHRGADAFYTALTSLLDIYFSRGNPPWRRAGCRIYLLEILYLLAKLSSQPADKGPASDAEALLGIDELLDYLEAHFMDHIDIAQAAAMLQWSESTFMRRFKRATGQTFVAYLTQLRLTKSLDLITASNLSIGEIAATLGFADQSYFDRRFRQRFGTTPRQARKDSSRVSS